MARPTPFPVTADVILIAECGGDPRVLLIERGHEPFAGRHAFPGGFVDPGETVDLAARRELAEETSLVGTDIELVQFGAYGPGGGRDPRGETLTVAFLGVVPEPLPAVAGDDAAAAEWVPLDIALRPGYLAFDHTSILGDAVDRWRAMPAAEAAVEAEAPSTAEFWNARYAADARMWSGSVNASLARAISELGMVPGRSLDLGSGEGADVIWLAEQGWRATGLELSEVAVLRARAAAAAQEFGAGSARFICADLAEVIGDDAGDASAAGGGLNDARGLRGLDLVTASFLQSPVELPREKILRVMAERIAPGGHLVVIAHASAPPWRTRPAAEAGETSPGHGHHHAELPSPESELASLALDPAGWEIVTAELWSRTVTSPEGETAEIEDSVVIVRRRAEGSAA